MDNDRDTTEHVMNLLEDLHALEARLAGVRQAHGLLAGSHYLAEIAAGLKAKEEGLLHETAEVRSEIVQIVIDAEVEAAKTAKRIDALEAALRESHPKAPPIWSGWSL
jgi:predicted transcriptional regulator